jgi:glycosyltransferase involved in cell wall biosynthesis
MKEDAKPHTIVHFMFTDFVWESRVLRQAQAALDAGLANKVVLIGYMDEGLKAYENISDYVVLHRLSVPDLKVLPRLLKRSLQWLYWSFAAAQLARRLDAELVQAHSLAAMVAGVIAKISHACPLIYDCHELETERAGWGTVQKKIARLMERSLLRFADKTLVVGRLIQTWYRETYGIDAALVRNLPTLPQPQNIDQVSSLREQAGIPKDHYVYVYLGAIGEGRGINLLLDVFKELPSDRHVVFLGRGELVDEIVSASKTSLNIHWLPPVASHEVVSFIRTADVGLAIIEDVSLSYRYCLPNKLFESRHAGLPILVSDLPEMAGYLEVYGGGWKTAPNVDAISRTILSIDQGAITQVLKAAKAPPTWNDEAQVYCAEVLKLMLSPT